AAFLSGTFYSIERLPGLLNDLAHLNPFFFMIDGFRSGFIGRADGDTLIGGIVLLVLNVALWLVCLWMFRTGYKLKS
ncbi:MAG: multidrug ABC transporter permease, partial [Rhodospirillaceae bacterium]|nr:multidrug ABC transporter permease [Rhodospirillaceae bacterium]